MSRATPLVVVIFLMVGTATACLMLWATERLLLFVQDPPVSYDDVLSPGLVGAVVLSLVWVLPGQLGVAALAGLSFSFFKRIPIWVVVLILIPLCGSFAAYRDISDSRDTIQKSDYRKLLYWLMVVTPGELLCAGAVSRLVKPAPLIASRTDNGS